MSQLGLIGNSVLTDIANAIRTQNGGTALYKHSEMAAAVLALDGTQEGDVLSKTASEGGGIVDDAYFSAIADAIRAQNGLSVTYTPPEMAPAILALEWDVGYKPRAVLLADGTLEFNYLEKRRAVTAGKVVTAYEISTEGYASASARPWSEVKLTITKVVIDPSFTQAGCTNADYCPDHGARRQRLGQRRVRRGRPPEHPGEGERGEGGAGDGHEREQRGAQGDERRLPCDRRGHAPGREAQRAQQRLAPPLIPCREGEHGDRGGEREPRGEADQRVGVRHVERAREPKAPHDGLQGAGGREQDAPGTAHRRGERHHGRGVARGELGRRPRREPADGRAHRGG